MSKLRFWSAVAGVVAIFLIGLAAGAALPGERTIVERQVVVTVPAGRYQVTATPVATATPTVRVVEVTATPRPTATPRSTSTPRPTPTPTTYTIQAGDNLSAIADRYGVEVDTLIAANDIADANLVAVGTVITIPSGASPQRRAIRSQPTRRTTATCPGPAEKYYLNTFGKHALDMAPAFDQLSSLIDRAIRNPRLIEDDAWRLDVIVVLAIIQANANTIRALNSPAKLQSIHQRVKNGMGHFVAGTQLIANGLDTYDSDAIAEGGRRFETGASYLNRATRDIEQFCK